MYYEVRPYIIPYTCHVCTFISSIPAITQLGIYVQILRVQARVNYRGQELKQTFGPQHRRSLLCLLCLHGLLGGWCRSCSFLHRLLCHCVEDWVTGVELLDYNCNSWATKWEQGCNAMPWTHARRKSMQSRHTFDKTLVVMVGCHLIYTYIYMYIYIYVLCSISQATQITISPMVDMIQSHIIRCNRMSQRGYECIQIKSLGTMSSRPHRSYASIRSNSGSSSRGSSLWMDRSLRCP